MEKKLEEKNAKLTAKNEALALEVEQLKTEKKELKRKHKDEVEELKLSYKETLKKTREKRDENSEALKDRRNQLDAEAKNLRAENKELQSLNKNLQEELDKAVDLLEGPTLSTKLVFDKQGFKDLSLNRVAVKAIHEHGRITKGEVPGVNTISKVFKDAGTRDAIIGSFLTSVGAGSTHDVVHVTGMPSTFVNILANLENEEVFDKVEQHLKVNQRKLSSSDEEDKLTNEEKVKISQFVEADKKLLEGLKGDKTIVIVSSPRNSIAFVS